MDYKFDKKSNYINVLKRIQKSFSTYEGYLINKNHYFTNNKYYYFLCILFRFVHLISFCGDFFIFYDDNNKSFKEYFKLFSIHNFLKSNKISDRIYMLISLLMLILLFTRILITQYFLAKINNIKTTQNWHIPNKFEIIYDHLIFLFFPFIIEFLSLIIYMLFFPKRFFLKRTISTIEIIIVLIVNTFLIISYNLENFINMFCINKTYTTTIFETNSKQIDEKKNNKRPISYKYSFIVTCILIFIQNFVLIINFENYIGLNLRCYFKIIISIILVLTIIILFLVKKNHYNYYNFINACINIIILYCFYTIIIDFIILYLLRYKIINILYEIIYILLKVILSYVTYILPLKKTNSFL